MAPQYPSFLLRLMSKYSNTMYKRRYFRVYQSGVLAYFKSETCGELYGIILLNTRCAVIDLRQSTLHISSAGTLYELRSAASLPDRAAADLRQWVDAMKRLQKALPPQGMLHWEQDSDDDDHVSQTQRFIWHTPSSALVSPLASSGRQMSTPDGKKRRSSC